MTTLRCPCCHAALLCEVRLGAAPEPTRAERIEEADPEACGRRWALDHEERLLAELEEESRT